MSAMKAYLDDALDRFAETGEVVPDDVAEHLAELYDPDESMAPTDLRHVALYYAVVGNEAESLMIRALAAHREVR